MKKGWRTLLNNLIKFHVYRNTCDGRQKSMEGIHEQKDDDDVY